MAKFEEFKIYFSIPTLPPSRRERKCFRVGFYTIGSMETVRLFCRIEFKPAIESKLCSTMGFQSQDSQLIMLPQRDLLTELLLSCTQ